MGIKFVLTDIDGTLTAVDETGGTVDIHYQIEIEDTAMGTVEYHLDIDPC